MLHGELEWCSAGRAANQSECREPVTRALPSPSVIRILEHSITPLCVPNSVPDRTCHPKHIIEATTAEAGPFTNFQGLWQSLSFSDAATKVFVIHSAGTQRSTRAHCHMRIADVAPRLPGSVHASSSMRSRSSQRWYVFSRQIFLAMSLASLS